MTGQVCFYCGNGPTPEQGLEWDGEGRLDHDHYGGRDYDSLSEAEKDEMVPCPGLPGGWGTCARCEGAFPLREMRAGEYHIPAEPDGAFGVSGGINNKYRPAREEQDYPPLASPTRNNNAFNNDEIASFHPGGANIVFGDGSVRFMKETTNILIIRALVTPAGGEVISADQY